VVCVPVGAGLELEAGGAGVVAVGAADGTVVRVLLGEELVTRFAGGDDVAERVRAGTAGLRVAG
jgi:hypothetical protein